jgi:hypothetical protein
MERVEIFDQTAGISEVRVAAAYTPVYSTENITNAAANTSPHSESSGGVPMFWKIIPLALIVALALAIYLIHDPHHNQRNRKEQQK